MHKFDGELSFLNAFVDKGEDQYKSATWLKSPFDASEWECDFGGEKSMSIRFSAVTLPDGKSLTSPRHHDLLDAIKQWLCVQTHPHATASKLLNFRSAYTRVQKTMHLIDYLLLNSKQLGLTDHGLAMLTRNDIQSLFASLSSSSDISKGIYDWPGNLRLYLLEQSSTIAAEDISDAARAIEGLMDPFGEDDAVLMLSEDELIRSRTWLWKNGLLKRLDTSGSSHAPEIAQLVGRIYGGRTLLEVNRRPVPPELCLGEIGRVTRELVGVPVRDTEDGRADTRLMALYKKCMKNLGLVAHGQFIGLRSALQILDENDQSLFSDLKEAGRFVTLPQPIVTYALRSSMEFALTHGTALVDSYLAVLSKATIDGCDFIEVANGPDFLSLVSPCLRDLGIRKWAIKQLGGQITHPVPNEIYFRQLRENVGLYELLRVFVASVGICVGTLMARRVKELSQLVSGSCLDSSGRYLLFKNKKAGYAHFEIEEARPIPPIAVQLIRMLERMHQRMLDLGFIDKLPGLLTHPARLTGRPTQKHNMQGLYGALDLFCDYFQMGGTKAGTRYYLRQHQLRRFFAIAFFWGSGFGGWTHYDGFLGTSTATISGATSQKVSRALHCATSKRTSRCNEYWTTATKQKPLPMS